MPIRKLSNGRFQAEYQNRFRRIARTRRTFDTRAEAKAWIAAVQRDASDRLLGHERRYLFGQALAKFLAGESRQKRTHDDDLGNARALRHPYPVPGGWHWIEDQPLQEVPAALAAWTADQRAIEARAYVGNELYQRRAGRWYQQPAVHGDGKPAPRREVTDPAILRAIAAAPGRGPVAGATLRIRQLLVARVLKLAARFWTDDGEPWLKTDVAVRIQLDKPARGRERFLDQDELLALVIAAPANFAAAILGAAWTGLRRANALGLTWDQVVFPVYAANPDGTREELQAGYIYVAGEHTKNGRPVAQPLSDRVLQLLQMQWACHVGRYVFHRGDGQPFADIKKLWAGTKRRAGLEPTLRFHDLRHTWASELAAAGVADRHLQALGGWQEPRMVARYTHLRMEQLRDAVNAPTRRTSS